MSSSAYSTKECQVSKKAFNATIRHVLDKSSTKKQWTTNYASLIHASIPQAISQMLDENTKKMVAQIDGDDEDQYVRVLKSRTGTQASHADIKDIHR
jgi:hypothetical protein